MRKNLRKATIVPAEYMELSELFRASGLELNLDASGQKPEGFLKAVKAVMPDGEILGGAAFCRRKDCFILNDIAVAEDVRGEDLGNRLLSYALTYFLEQGAKTVWIASKAPGFFARAGFQEVPKEQAPDIFSCGDCAEYGTDCHPAFMRMDLSGERLLFVDACVSTHRSRTRQLCDAYLGRYAAEHPGVVIDHVMVEKGICEPLDREAILHRNDLIEAKAWDDPMFDLARQFKAASQVVVGAPYWDCAFPAILKVYIENIVVTDLTFEETENGYSGLCPCNELVYITTAGGPIEDRDLGYDYIRGIGTMLGVKSFREYRAEGLDIVGADIPAIMDEALKKIKE